MKLERALRGQKEPLPKLTTCELDGLRLLRRRLLRVGQPIGCCAWASELCGGDGSLAAKILSDHPPPGLSDHPPPPGDAKKTAGMVSVGSYVLYERNATLVTQSDDAAYLKEDGAVFDFTLSAADLATLDAIDSPVMCGNWSVK